MKYTPENITSLKPNQIFCYGANRSYKHGAGAAKTALKFGAIYGKGPFYGQTYGISTKDENIQILPLSEIKKEIDAFINFVALNPDKEFLLTRIGTGLAGYSDEQIAGLFQFRKYIPPNIIFPREFAIIIWGDDLKTYD